MARTTITIKEKIERQKQVVSKHKTRYEAKLEKLDALIASRIAELRQRAACFISQKWSEPPPGRHQFDVA